MSPMQMPTVGILLARINWSIRRLSCGALAIVASLLVGPTNMTFLGNVVDNITNLVKSLGSAGLAGLISLGVVLWLVQNK